MINNQKNYKYRCADDAIREEVSVHSPFGFQTGFENSDKCIQKTVLSDVRFYATNPISNLCINFRSNRNIYIIISDLSSIPL